MSNGARTTLAIAAFIGALGFLLTGVFLGADLPAGSTPFYGSAAFCCVIVIACLVRCSRPVTLRIIGSVVCLIFVWNAYLGLAERDYARTVGSLMVWALPSGYLAMRGEFPRWGKAAAAFRSDMGPDRQRHEGN